MNVDLDKVVAHVNRRAEVIEELATQAQERADTLNDEIARQEARLHRVAADRLRCLAADLPWYGQIGALS